MRSHVSLSLTGSHVVLHGAQEARARVKDADWRAVLAKVLELCRSRKPQAKLDIQAQLGMDHARVAIMTVDQPGGFASLPAEKHEMLVHAWAADMLHVATHAQVIRWRALADPQKILVSCVDRAIVHELQQACDEARAELSSCRPAIFAAMRAAERQLQDHTVIWTEDGSDGARHGTVQLLRFRGRGLTASWRGWLPVDRTDEGLDTMVSRFESATGGALNGPRARMHWPTAALG